MSKEKKDIKKRLRMKALEKELERLKREPETIIADRMGWYHDAYYCDEYAGCPYAFDDVEGNVACYKERFEHCPNYEDDWDD